jgi:hypothetical protein
LTAVAVPIALMGAMLIMERLEHRVLGTPAHADEDRSGAALPAVPPTSTTERKIVSESPRAA